MQERKLRSVLRHDDDCQAAASRRETNLELGCCLIDVAAQHDLLGCRCYVRLGTTRSYFYAVAFSTEQPQLCAARLVGDSERGVSALQRNAAEAHAGIAGHAYLHLIGAVASGCCRAGTEHEPENGCLALHVMALQSNSSASDPAAA